MESVWRSCPVSHEKDGLTYHQLQPKVKLKDDVNEIQVLTLGDPNDKSTRIVSLLGEAGAGKTTLLTGMVNHLHGVQMHQNRRLWLKDQRDQQCGAPRQETESQTDWVTAYVICHQEGMPYDYNHVIIDTPGLNDTRGRDRQRKTTNQLMTFLKNDFGIDYLNCIGLVVKAQENRQYTHQKEIFREFRSYLGEGVEQVNCLLVTHAADTTPVVQVLSDLGITFDDSKIFKFDNWPVLTSTSNGSLSDLDRQILQLKQKAANEAYVKFFRNLTDLCVDLKTTRELVEKRAVLGERQNDLRRYLADADRVVKTITDCVDEIQLVLKLSKRGFHGHFCPDCGQVCEVLCEDPFSWANVVIPIVVVSVGIIGLIALYGANLRELAARLLNRQRLQETLSYIKGIVPSLFSKLFCAQKKTTIDINSPCDYLRRDSCSIVTCHHSVTSHLIYRLKLNDDDTSSKLRDLKDNLRRDDTIVKSLEENLTEVGEEMVNLQRDISRLSADANSQQELAHLIDELRTNDPHQSGFDILVIHFRDYVQSLQYEKDGILQFKIPTGEKYKEHLRQ